MGIFATIRRALRKGGALPNEHGPAVIVRNAKGNWVEDPKELKQSKCGDECNCDPKQAMSVTITRTKATTDDKPETVPAAKLSPAEKNATTAAKAAVAKPKPTKLEQVKADAERMNAAKKSPAKPSTSKAAPKKPTPKKK